MIILAISEKSIRVMWFFKAVSLFENGAAFFTLTSSKIVGYDGSENYKAADLIAAVYARTWGDVHAWIHINGYDKFKKTKKKGKNKKK
ncbi:MAG: hypothetical protein J6Q84_06910 [Kiritimatiellae bacterium]|nr:hypothetical protein [Kiritimatiellia bacterium]